jgi:hypothetical protein
MSWRSRHPNSTIPLLRHILVIYPGADAVDDHDAKSSHVNVGGIHKLLSHRVSVERVLSGTSVVEDDSIVGQVTRMESEMVGLRAQETGTSTRERTVRADVTGDKTGRRWAGDGAGSFF